MVRDFLRVVESASDMITLRRCTLALALACAAVVVTHIVHVALTDSPLFGDGLLTFFYVFLSYGWVGYLVVCCRDHVRATAAADREVLMAEICSLRQTVDGIAYERGAARRYPAEYAHARDGRSRFGSIESTPN